jgi:mono/diheme cytochrome c family protein
MRRWRWVVGWGSILLLGVVTVLAQSVQWPEPRLQPGQVIENGRRVYMRYCVGCHGERGDGNGPAAAMLWPKPRDFRDGVFKFLTVPRGDLPPDRDLFRIVTHGLPGSAMPSWRLLPETERWAVIQYIKTLSTRWQEETPSQPIEVAPDPYALYDPDQIRTEVIPRGEAVYHGLTKCWACHPAYVSADRIAEYLRQFGRGEEAASIRPDLSKPQKTTDRWGNILFPPDFTRNRLKSVSSLEDLYIRIGAGVGGTEMPVWKGQIPEEDLWAVTYYVASLIEKRGVSLPRRRPL